MDERRDVNCSGQKRQADRDGEVTKITDFFKRKGIHGESSKIASSCSDDTANTSENDFGRTVISCANVQSAQHVLSKTNEKKRKLREDWKIVHGDPESTKDRQENLIIDGTNEWGMWCKCCTEISPSLGVAYLSNFVKDHPKFKPPDRKRQTVNLHFGSKTHKLCVEKAQASSMKSSESVVYKAISRMGPDIQMKMEKLFRIVFAMILEDRSARRFAFECQLQEMNGVSLGKTYHNDFSFNIFLNFIDRANNEKTFADVSAASAIAVLTDGSTTKANHEYEAVCLRYVSTKDETPCVKVIFIGLGHIQQRANAEGLLKSITTTMDESGIEGWKDKLVCCTLDGASVNVGHKGGLITKLGTPTHVHCYNHVFDLAVKETIKEDSVATKTMGLVRSISTFYRNSPKLYRELQITAKALDTEVISLKAFCETRWADSLEAVVSPLIRNYQAITAHLEQVVSEHTDYKKDQKAAAKGFLNQLLNYNTIYFLYGLADFIATVAKTSRKLEYTDLLLNRAANLIKRTKKAMQEMQIRPSNCPLLTKFLEECVQSESLDTNSTNDCQFKGQTLKEQSRKRHISGFQKTALPWDQVKTFFKSFEENLQSRFSSDSPLLQAFQVLDGAYFPDDEDELKSYGVTEMKKLFAIFNVDAEIGLQEWSDLKQCIQTHFKRGTDYFRLLKMLNTKDMKHLKLMRYLVEALLCTPPSNAEVERVWSGTKSLLGENRLRMNRHTLEQRLKSEKEWW